MTSNFKKRFFTSLFLFSVLLMVIYSHTFIFGLSLLVVGFIVCIEFNNIFRKFVGNLYSSSSKFNLKFFILMWIPFIYMFFIFGLFSFDIYKSQGPTFFLFIISICFFSDIGGYAFGKVIGGKKLTKISPNKTISGSIGSFVFSLFSIIILWSYNNFTEDVNLVIDNFLKLIPICLFLCLICQLGDLFISYFKRRAKVDDTGSILPGHGGLLDRVDGVIFVMPAAYLVDRVFF